MIGEKPYAFHEAQQHDKFLAGLLKRCFGK